MHRVLPALLGALSISCTARVGVDAFLLTESVAVGADAWRLAAGDLDGDGHLDLVTINYVAGTASVLLGRGDGTFHVSGTYPVGAAPAALVLRDLDGDGHLDAAIASGGGGYVRVMLGHGDGTFGAPSDYPMPVQPNGLAAGDLNGDGRPDLVVAIAGKQIGDNPGTGFTVLLGGPAGAYSPAFFIGSSLDPGFVALADVDGDGKLDLIATGDPADLFSPSTGLVRVFLGRGDGSFGPELESPAGASPGAAPATNFALGDFDGDGKLDMAVVTREPSLAILRGKGDGTFAFDAAHPIPSSAGTVEAADFDRDGRLDLVEADQNPSSVGLWLGGPNGIFQLSTRLSADEFPFGIAVGDFDGDGKPDFAAADFASSEVDVFLNEMP